MARTREIERRSDVRIPVISRCVVLEHFLGLEKETERSDWINSLPLKLQAIDLRARSFLRGDYQTTWGWAKVFLKALVE